MARVGGAFLSPALLKGGQKVITPNVTSKTARVRAAKYFDKKNIPYSAGQKTGSKNQQYRESETGGAAYADMIERQQLAFNREALKKIGGQGRRSDAGSDGRGAHAHRQHVQTVWRSATALRRRTSWRATCAPRCAILRQEWAAPAPVVKDIVDEISYALTQKGQISGAQYQSMITRLRNAGKGNDPTGCW